MINCYRRKRINHYPRFLFLIISFSVIILHIMLCIRINHFFGYAEWQLYSLLYKRAFNIIILIIIPMINLLGIVSFPKYLELWQLIFTIILIIPIIISLTLVCTLAKNSVIKSMKSIMNTIYEPDSDFGIEIQPFISSELKCTELTDDENTGCLDLSIDNVISKQIRPLKNNAILILMIHIINFLINLGYLLVFETPDSRRHFGSSSDGDN